MAALVRIKIQTHYSERVRVLRGGVLWLWSRGRGNRPRASRRARSNTNRVRRSRAGSSPRPRFLGHGVNPPEPRWDAYAPWAAGAAGRLTHAEAHQLHLPAAGASQPTCGGLVVAVVGWLARRSKSVWAWVCSGRSAEAWRPTYWGLVTALVSGAGASRATCWGLGTAPVIGPARRHLAFDYPVIIASRVVHARRTEALKVPFERVAGHGKPMRHASRPRGTGPSPRRPCARPRRLIFPGRRQRRQRRRRPSRAACPFCPAFHDTRQLN